MLTLTRRRIVVFASLLLALPAALGIVRLAEAAAPQRGIDVSEFQGSIDWNAVARSGITFAFIRAGEGATYRDPYFQQNWNGASAAGITTGAYLFFHPSIDPTAQANLLLQQLQSVPFGPGRMLPAIDVETTDGLPPAQVIQALWTTVQDIEGVIGAPPAIYAAPSWWDGNVGSSGFSSDPLWVANWCGSCPGPAVPANNWGGAGWQVWQYADNGSVPGISGSVDLDAGNPNVPLYSGKSLPAVSGGIAIRADGTSGYSVDGEGNITPFGGAPAAAPSALWPNWDIVRGIALRSDGVSGYVVDGWGGIHTFGGAPQVVGSAYWPGYDIARGIVVRSDGVSGYVLDGWGGIHPFGGAPQLWGAGYWPGWDIVRGFALDADGAGGQVVDAWGGLHSFGNAPPETGTAYWPNQDVARGVAVLPSGSGGYVLDGWGGLHTFGSGAGSLYGAPWHPNVDSARGIALTPCSGAGGICVALHTSGFSGASAGDVAVDAAMPHVTGGVAYRGDGVSGYSVDGFGTVTPFGGAPPVTQPGAFPGTDIARGIALRPDGVSGYVLDGYGGLHPFGGAPTMPNRAYWPDWDIARGLTLDSDGLGGQILDGWGGLHAVGNAQSFSVSAYWSGWDIARSIALDPDGAGGQVLDGWGGTHAFGNAPSLSGPGYWPNHDIARGLALFSANGGYVLDGYGDLSPVGSNVPYVNGAPPAHPGSDTARDIAASSCLGGWHCLAIQTFWHGIATATDQVVADEGGVALRAGGTSGYSVDEHGTITAIGDAPAVAASSTWSGNVVRGVALRSDGVSGYTVDAFGGVHPFGGAPAVSGGSAWSSADIVRGIVLRSDGVSGYVLDGWGGIHPFGGAPYLYDSGYWPGWDIVRGFALLPSGAGGYVLDGWGGIHTFGAAPFLSGAAYWQGWDIARAIALLPSGAGGYVLDGWGGLHTVGTAPVATSPNYHGGVDTARGLSLTTCTGSTACGALQTFGGQWPAAEQSTARFTIP